MIWIIGGTSEASECLGRIQKTRGTDWMDEKIIVTSATESFRESFGGVLLVGKLNRSDMEQLIRTRGITLVCDFSHPFATEVTENARGAAESSGTGYMRFERESSSIPAHAIVCRDYNESMEYLKNHRGRVLFTTGVNMAPRFMEIRDKESEFIFRVLPDVDSIRILKEAGVEMKDIIAMKGPFSKEMNMAMMKEKGISLLVTKESGQRGGFTAKVEAAESLGVGLLVIRRPEDNGTGDPEVIRDMDTAIGKIIEAAGGDR